MPDREVAQPVAATTTSSTAPQRRKAVPGKLEAKLFNPENNTRFLPQRYRRVTKLAMLYERWRSIVQRQASEVALRDLTAGRNWTFARLSAGSEMTPGQNGPMVFPWGGSAEFILAVLRGWRQGRIVCPVEAGQQPPDFAQLPPGCVHIKTTSATTGDARAVAFTAEQLAADAENIVATMGLRRDWPNLGVISMAYSYGFSNLVLPLLLHGIPLILAPAPLPKAVRRAAALVPELTLPAVPALWRAWHDTDSIPPNVKLAISAGAPLPVELEQAVFAARGLKLHNFYGSTECGGIAYDASETPRTDAACVGRAMKNVSLSVAEDGCLEVRSRAVAETYWPLSDLSLGGGCFRTNDIAEISGGQVYLRGRAGDQINVAGRKVLPETIERALLQHPHILECLVFGVPSRDAERSEEIVAAIVSREHEAALRKFAVETLPAWQSPRHWWFVETVQTNSRGKVSRAEWRSRFVRQQSGQG